MQRVVSIHLNGSVYQLEEGGYTALFAYLDAIETRLKDDPDRIARIAEVEQAVAGKCQACLAEHKTVVTTAEVARIISEMEPVPGAAAPSSQSVAGERASAGAAPSTEPSAGAGTGGEKARTAPHYHRRLCQIREGGMVGGVCLGLATFFHIDVTLVRILFAVFVLATGGWGILAYLGLMFLLPRAASVAEAEAPGPQTWPWDDGWPWDKHGWPWDRPGWPFTPGLPDEWRQQRRDAREQRLGERQQRREEREQRREDRREARDEWRAMRVASAPPPSMFSTLIIVLSIMLAFGWLTFWMRGAFIGGLPIFWGGPFFWGFPHWFSIVIFLVLFRFLLWPLRARRWGAYGHYGWYEPYGPWMAIWHTFVWIGSIIFLLWLAGQFVPGLHEILLQFQDGWPRGRFDV